MQLSRSIREHLRRAIFADAGFTVVETIVTVALALVVLVPVSFVLTDMQQASTGTIQRADAVQLAEVGLRSMDQQLRGAYQVEFPTSSSGCSSPWCSSIASGVQTANVVDVLTRVKGTDYEIRYDCTVASKTITTDRACWQYKCSASASTGSGSSCTSTTSGVTKGLVIDQLTNGTNASPVFSFCYQNLTTTGNACASGATRPSSATVTIDVPAAGTLSTSHQNGDPTTVQLTDNVYMTNLDLNLDQ